MRPFRIAVCLLLLGAVAHAQKQDAMQQARSEFEAGQTAYNLAQYESALAHYQRAYELSKLPALLFNLAQARRKLYEKNHDLTHLRMARELYRSYLRQVAISDARQLAESLLGEVEKEYTRVLHEQRDRLLADTQGPAALGLAEDFLAQDDLEAAGAALARFSRTPGNRRAQVAKAARLRARLAANRGDERTAEESWARAFELDPSTPPPPESDARSKPSFLRAQARMKQRPQLSLAHVPPTRVKIGEAPRLRVDVVADTLGLVRSLQVRYRANGGAYARLSAQPGTIVFPDAFNAGLRPGTRIDYDIEALDADGAVIDALGSDTLPFSVAVDTLTAKPVWKKWPFWVGLGAGALVIAGAATAIGVTQAPPERVGIPINAGLTFH